MAKLVLKYGLAAAAIAVSTMSISDAALAITWGKRQPDGMVCRVLFGKPHDHGSYGRANTQSGALAAAHKRWVWFTSFEYGKRWGNWNLARRKKVECGPSRRGGWKCEVEGQPCRY